MAVIASEVLVQIGGDTSPLRRDLKKATNSLDKFGGKVRKSANDMAKWGAAAAAAAVVAAGAMVKGAAASAKELDNLSRIARLSNEEFQKYAFAAKSVGVEQDKLADIIKDSNDKMGDFLVTGAGPLVDFFEQIAPKIGVTSDEFRNLSGPQVLQKYVDGLEKANVSQAEMTFFMEAIASDATALLPLLRDGGKAMKEQGDEAKRLGLILSDIDVQILKDTQDTFEDGAKAVQVFTQRLAVQLAPVITVISNRLKEAASDSVGLADVSTKAFDAIARAVGFAGDTIRGLQAVVKGLELGFDVLKLGAITVVANIVEAFNWMDNQVRNMINELIRGINKIPKINIDELVTGENAATSKMKEWQQEAAAGMHETVQEMHELLMKPLPSEVITDFMSDVNEAARQAAAVVVEARNEALEIPGLDTNNDIKQINSLKDAYEQYAFSVIDSNEMIAASEKQQAENRATMVSAAGTAFGNLSTLMSSENKKQFEIGKKAAKAQAVVDTYASAQAAFKSLAGIPIIGPALGAAAAGAAVVAGFSRVRAINSTSFGGGGSGGGASSSGGGAGVSSAGSSQQSAPQSSGTLTVEGLSAGAIFSGDAVAELATTLLDYQREGGRIVLAA